MKNSTYPLSGLEVAPEGRVHKPTGRASGWWIRSIVGADLLC
jgi:hypothetical protein